MTYIISTRRRDGAEAIADNITCWISIVPQREEPPSRRVYKPPSPSPPPQHHPYLTTTLTTTCSTVVALSAGVSICVYIVSSYALTSRRFGMSLLDCFFLFFFFFVKIRLKTFIFFQLVAMSQRPPGPPPYNP